MLSLAVSRLMSKHACAVLTLSYTLLTKRLNRDGQTGTVKCALVEIISHKTLDISWQ